MPLYDYDCAACGQRFEVVHGVHADPPTACPLCGKGPIRKAISAPTIHYKGSGWAKKERHASAARSSSSSADGSSSDASSGDKPSSDKSSSEGSTDSAAAKSESPKADGDSKKKAKTTEPATAKTTD